MRWPFVACHPTLGLGIAAMDNTLAKRCSAVARQCSTATANAGRRLQQSCGNHRKCEAQARHHQAPACKMPQAGARHVILKEAGVTSIKARNPSPRPKLCQNPDREPPRHSGIRAAPRKGPAQIHQRPVNFGARFCRNAITPSRKSALRPASPCSCASSSS